MAKRPLPSPDMLRQLLDYDQNTGKLFWKPRKSEWFKDSARFTAEGWCDNWNRKYSGKEAFTTIEPTGYHRGTIFCRNYNAHRVIWAIQFGHWPIGQVDHINGDRSDNRIVNLRDVSVSQNQRNRSINRNNSSGRTGVKQTKHGRWRASIKIDKEVGLGSFSTFEEACAARSKAEMENGYHPNHGARPSAYDDNNPVSLRNRPAPQPRQR